MSDFDDVRCLDARLADKLEMYAVRLHDAHPNVANAYSELIKRLVDSGAGDNAPDIGDSFPSFALPDSAGHVRTLESFLERGPLVVSFNRGHWCSFCKLELLALNDIVPEISDRGAGLVSIMPETARYSRHLREDFDLAFQILTDIDNGFALQSNLMIALGPAVSELLLKLGDDLSRFQGNGAWFVPIPATYVIDKNGLVAAAHVDADFRRRMAPDDILSALDRL